MGVTVYTKNNCVQCVRTKKKLKAQNIEFSEVNIEESPAAYDFITQDLGYKSAPVVCLEDGSHWAGYQPEKISEIR